MDDGPYEDYLARVATKCDEDLTSFAGSVAGRYQRDAELHFSPRRFEGCTTLALPYPLELPVLAKWQTGLAQSSGHFAAIPAETLHLTLADIAAGAEYERLSPGEQKVRLRRAATVVGRHDKRTVSVAQIAGLGMFPGAVIALVRVTRDAYEWIHALRRALYEELADAGVRQHFQFISHITLGYIEDVSAHSAIRQQLERLRATVTWPRFELHGAAVFTFPHMSQYEQVSSR